MQLELHPQTNPLLQRLPLQKDDIPPSQVVSVSRKSSYVQPSAPTLRYPSQNQAISTSAGQCGIADCRTVKHAYGTFRTKTIAVAEWDLLADPRLYSYSQHATQLADGPRYLYVSLPQLTVV